MKWAEFGILLDAQKFYGTHWDKAEPDDGGMKELMQWQLEVATGNNDDTE